MTTPISTPPWDLATDEKWKIDSVNPDHANDTGNEVIVDAKGNVVAYVSGNNDEGGNGALLAAAPALRTALDEAVRVLDRIAETIPRGRMWEIAGETLKVSRAALKQAGALP